MATKKNIKKIKAPRRSALDTARVIIATASPADKDSDLYRWAKLVVNRDNEGRSIANADEWLGSIMAGVDPEYLD